MWQALNLASLWTWRILELWKRPLTRENHIKNNLTKNFVRSWQTINRRLHLSVYTWRKKTRSNCRRTVEVWVGVRRMFTCKVDNCLLTWFDFDQQNIHRKTLRRISGAVKLQRIILKSKCAVSVREILLKIVKNKRWVERAHQKHVNNLTFGATVCFNGCRTSNVWRQNTLTVSGTLLEPVFCLVSKPRCNRRYFTWNFVLEVLF